MIDFDDYVHPLNVTGTVSTALIAELRAALVAALDRLEMYRLVDERMGRTYQGDCTKQLIDELRARALADKATT